MTEYRVLQKVEHSYWAVDTDGFSWQVQRKRWFGWQDVPGAWYLAKSRAIKHAKMLADGANGKVVWP